MKTYIFGILIKVKRKTSRPDVPYTQKKHLGINSQQKYYKTISTVFQDLESCVDKNSCYSSIVFNTFSTEKMFFHNFLEILKPTLQNSYLIGENLSLVTIVVCN